MTETTTVTEPRKFLTPEILYGVGSRGRAGQYARNLGTRRALVVSDPGVREAGWTDQVRQGLRDAGVETALFTDVTPNPRDAEVEEVYVRAL